MRLGLVSKIGRGPGGVLFLGRGGSIAAISLAFFMSFGFGRSKMF
jgi:hypothetical protein